MNYAIALMTFLLWSAALAGQASPSPGPWQVAHQRTLWRDAPGSLALTPTGLEFAPPAKKSQTPKPIVFGWEEIQQLTLSERSVEIVTYRDVVWQLGRDRTFRFVLPGGTSDGFAAMEAAVRAGLGSRLIVALPLPASPESADARWEIPARLTGLLRGVEGTLAFTGEELVFSALRAERSRRWPIGDLDAISQTGPFSLTVTAPERALADQGGHRSFSFQLKQPLSAERYRQLWRAMELGKGTRLRFRDSQ